MIFNVGAGNGGSVVYVTQAEYDALPDSKLTNNIEYRIIDGNADEGKASNLSYDNSFSGLEAVNVQTAIDKVNESLGSYSKEEIKTSKTWINGKPIYRRVFEYTVTSNWTVNGKRYQQWSVLTSSNDIEFIVNYQIPNITLDIGGEMEVREYASCLVTTDNNITIGVFNAETKYSQGVTLVCIVEYTKTTD